MSVSGGPPNDDALRKANALRTADAIKTAAGLLRSARHAVVFTGAGISTPSGIPDFRSRGTGLWEKSNPMEVSSLGVFQSHPERFYGWLRPLLQQIWAAQPNPAHIALARLEEAGIIKAVITQNIDDLHRRAGSRNIYEVHGSLRTVTCPGCKQSWPAEKFRSQIENGGETQSDAAGGKDAGGINAVGINAGDKSTADDLPRCQSCSKVLKPDIVLFGEMLPFATWQSAEDHCQRADVILVVGSSLEVWPAASLPELAVEHNAHLIINNLTPTYLDEQSEVLLPADVADVLPKIASMLL